MADDLIDVIDADGKRHRISEAHRNRWPSVQEAFRIAPAKKTTPVVEEVISVTTPTPTGDKNKEN